MNSHDTRRSLDAAVTVGAVLGGGARIALRHWLLCLVGIIGMAGMLLLLLDLAGACFGVGNEACISPASFDVFGGQKQAVIGDLITLVPLIGAFAVGLVVLRLLYLLEPAEAPGHHAMRSVGLRPLRFTGRLAVIWVIIAVPLLVLDSAYRHVAWLLYPDFAGRNALLLGYILVKAIGLALASYLHARVLLYLPAVAYQEEPESFTALWHATHAVRWRLFLVFFPLDVGTVLLQTALDTWMPQAVDLSPIAQGLADWSRLEPNYVAAVLPAAIVYAVIVPVTDLWTAGIALVTYRRLITIDHARAGVFD